MTAALTDVGEDLAFAGGATIRSYLPTEAGDGESPRRWRVRIGRAMRPVIEGLVAREPDLRGRRPTTQCVEETDDKKARRT